MDTRTGKLLSTAEVMQLQAMGQTQFLMNLVAAPPTPEQEAVGKIGRNDPCPCGSGKKFKKCHLGKKA